MSPASSRPIVISCYPAGTTSPVCSIANAVGSHYNLLSSASFRLPSFKGPVTWLRESLAPGVREQNTKEEIEAARKRAAEKGQLGVFESAPTLVEGDVTAEETPAWKKKTYTEVRQVSLARSTRVAHIAASSQHKYSTANFKISHRKLNLLANQIAGKPIDSAILQMMFSEKRASKRIKSMLVVAKSHAVKLKSLNEQKLIVCAYPTPHSID